MALGQEVLVLYLYGVRYLAAPPSAEAQPSVRRASQARADADQPADAHTTAGEERYPANSPRKPCGAAQAHRQRGDTLCAIDATARRERSLRGQPT